MYLWLALNSLRSICVLSTEIKDVCYHVQLEIHFFPFEDGVSRTEPRSTQMPHEC